MSGSDSPDYEFESEDGSDRNSDYEDYEDRGAISSGAEEGNAADSGSVVSAPRILMCPKYPPGKMIEVCKGCNSILEMVRPEIATQLMAPPVQCSAVGSL